MSVRASVVANARSAAGEIVLLGRPFTHCDIDTLTIETAMTIKDCEFESKKKGVGST